MPNEADNRKDAKKILDLLQAEGDIEFKLVEGVTYISVKNENFKPDNGQNPYFCCTLEHLILAIHKVI